MKQRDADSATDAAHPTGAFLTYTFVLQHNSLSQEIFQINQLFWSGGIQCSAISSFNGHKLLQCIGHLAETRTISTILYCDVTAFTALFGIFQRHT